MTDEWPGMIRDFVARRGSANPLLVAFVRQVAWVTRRYPAAWFTGGQRTDEAIDDLAHRAFTVCARVQKGRFPFTGREPFRAYVEERFDGKAIRYHSFYAKLSITRELMRDDYARNLTRDPVLRERARLYQRIGVVLKAEAQAVPQGRGVPPLYRLGSGLAVIVPLEVLEAELKASGERDVATLVKRALQRGGPLSQSQLTVLLEEVLGIANVDAPMGSDAPPTFVAQDLDVREAVIAAWRALDDEAKSLLGAIARGLSYDEIIAEYPAFQHRVAVTRALARCSQSFVERVLRAVGEERLASAATPKQLIEHVVEVLWSSGELRSEVADGVA